MHNWDTYGEFWNLCLKRPLKARQLHTGLLMDKYNFPLKRFKRLLKLLCFRFLYIINFLPSNGFYLFWKFSKETFLFLCWLWAGNEYKGDKNAVWVFFFFQALTTYLPIYFSFTQSIRYVHIRTYSLSTYCIQCFPQRTSMSQTDLCCSQGNKKINRTEW